MIDLNFMTLIGLVGVTLVIAVGKIFESTRTWLQGFTHRWNPLRFIGEAMGCTMCAGWWVGFAWGLYAGHGAVGSIITGGVISMAAYVGDELLAILTGLSMRTMRGLRSGPPPVAPPEPKRRPLVPDEEESLTEAEAHEASDKDEA